MKTIEVVAAIIRQDDKILATQRGYGDYRGWWEFPGGKVEPGETGEQAIRREIHEELGALIEVDRFVITVDWDYEKFHLTMHCYLSHVAQGHLQLIEHMSARWVDAQDIDTVDWLPADELVVKALKEQGVI
mgnify:CR=1 FL=1